MRINRSGFTIVELVVVIFVIGILAGITLIAYNGVQARTRDDRRKTDVENIEKAMELYYSDNGSYPVPTGSTSSVINPAWYSSDDGSWSMLSGLLVGSQAIDALPVDPINTPNKSPLAAGNYGYAVFVNSSGSYCGAGRGQMYLIVYRLEGMPKERKTDGPCTTNPLGDNYYDSGASYYRNIKSGS